MGFMYIAKPLMVKTQAKFARSSPYLNLRRFMNIGPKETFKDMPNAVF